LETSRKYFPSAERSVDEDLRERIGVRNDKKKAAKGVDHGTVIRL